MITKDLIALLQKLVDEHAPHVEVMGEHEIMIDVFEEDKEHPHLFVYKGFSPDIQVELSSDSVYHILSRFNTV